MLIGVPTEIKTHEYRVGLTTGSVLELVHHGHQVLEARPRLDHGAGQVGASAQAHVDPQDLAALATGVLGQLLSQVAQPLLSVFGSVAGIH